MKRTRTLPVALALVLVLGACSKKPQPAPAPAPQAEHSVDADAARRAAEERARREAEEARRLAEEAARALEILASAVYFDYDSFSVRDDSRAVLDAKVPLLRQSPATRITIAGHADERGSTEYNIALGMRRATAARDYLTAFGVDPVRLLTISYGEERPAEEGQDEWAWSKNRRAEFQVQGGGR